MRVAIVHSFYSSRLPSGENEMVLAQAALLRELGHEVLLLGRRTDDLEAQPGYAWRAGLRVATGLGGDPTDRLAAFAPDVVHVHNLFPNIGTRWLRSWPGPLVATQHNYRSICANGLLFRDGAGCTLCPDGDPWAGVRHACYRESRLATLPLAVRTRGGVGGDPTLARADRVVLLSPWQQEVLVRHGLDPSRVDLIPNFVTGLHAGAAPAPERERWVCVGRMTPEKGLASLLEEWPDEAPLDVIGSGPEADLARHPAVRVRGQLARADLRELLPGYTGLLLPSRWSEAAVPLVAVEALEAGLPVVVRAGTGVAGLVGGAGAGAVWGEGQPLGRALAGVASAGDAMREQARRAYEAGFAADRWVDDITACYERAMR